MADWVAIIQLTVLMLSVPAQYYITTIYPTSSHQAQKALRDIVNRAESLLHWGTWEKWCTDMFNRLTVFNKSLLYKPWTNKKTFGELDKDGESPAVEIMKYEDKNGNFAMSPQVRRPRSAQVKFHVGQVVQHTRWGYRGVIVGWDPIAKAPEDWLAANHGTHRTWSSQPNYAVLVDSRDRSPPQITYVPQENLKVIENNMRIINEELQHYFDGYDGRQYIARPALKELYPDD